MLWSNSNVQLLLWRRHIVLPAVRLVRGVLEGPAVRRRSIWTAANGTRGIELFRYGAHDWQDHENRGRGFDGLILTPFDTNWKSGGGADLPPVVVPLLMFVREPLPLGGAE